MKKIIDLNEKKILVTGASRGIGKAVALQLAELGANVVLVSRNLESMEKVMEEMQGEGKHMAISHDLSEVESVEEIFKKAVQDGLKLDGMVHCAGISKMIPLNMIKYETMDEIMRVNFYAFMEMIKCFAKKKYSVGGSVVGISSTASANGEKCQTVYTATKGAMDAVIRPLSKELLSKNIRINTVRPGLTETEMGSELMFLTGRDKDMELEVTQPMGMVQPEDVANLVSFLLSDAARFITGRTMFVDGGRP